MSPSTTSPCIRSSCWRSFGRRGAYPKLIRLLRLDSKPLDIAFGDEITDAENLLNSHPFRRPAEERQNRKQAVELFWQAFCKTRRICGENGLESPADFDKEHEIHHYCEEWLNPLLLFRLLSDAGDMRWQRRSGPLPGPNKKRTRFTDNDFPENLAG